MSSDTKNSPGNDPDLQALRDELKQLRDDMGKITGSLKDLLRHKGSEARAQVEEKAEQAWAEVRGAAVDASQKIHEKPVQSAFIALAIGFVLGCIFSGRR